MRFATSGRAVLISGIVASLFAAGSALADGKDTYDKTCSVCHATGVANAPKFGDKAAWATRIATGADALLASVVKGKGAMPAKAGTTLSDGELKEAIAYMTSAAK